MELGNAGRKAVNLKQAVGVENTVIMVILNPFAWQLRKGPGEGYPLS